MSTRPITGWTYSPGAPSCLQGVDNALSEGAESEPALSVALEVAMRRWGPSRIACLTACEGWAETTTVEPGCGISYGKLGPNAPAELLTSAWALIEANLVDAALLRSGTRCGLLVERAGSAELQLGRETSKPVDLEISTAAVELLRVVVAASAAIERGLACGEQGIEPERVRLATSVHTWIVEVRA